MDKKLCKSNQNKKIAGVCGGLGEYFNIDATLIRLALVLFCILGGSGILAYIICALVIPEAPSDGSN
jgi:phage shock protein C